MNIIRTKAMELSVIPAMAYKFKLASGGAGIKLLRLDSEAFAVAGIDRRSGEAQPKQPVDAALFPHEAFEEAVELVAGLPFSARGKIVVRPMELKEEEDVEITDAPEQVDMVDSDEYQAIVERYSDEKGKLNYRLMNKDFIQFASKSKAVADLIAAGANVDDILLFVVKSRATFISGKKESLSDELTAALIETLDEIDPRSAFKELSAHLKRMLARR